MDSASKIIVKGRVQGVGFRQSTLRFAQKYPSVSGFVRNLPEGSVEAFFCGPREDVDVLVEWCKHGPPNAQVDSFELQLEVDALQRQFTGKGFKILF